MQPDPAEQIAHNVALRDEARRTFDMYCDAKRMSLTGRGHLRELWTASFMLGAEACALLLAPDDDNAA